MKAAIVVLSDPKGGEESLGRLFNALAAAHEFKQRKDQVELVFQGAGTRWVEEVRKPDHPARALYEAVQDTVVGVSCACADVFGARKDVEKSGLPLLTANPIPGTSGLASLARYAADGFTVMTF
ncbi:MAG: DsrE family protein [Myxococcaceae bacterium]|nr:DsrE family protein [Myxococcaceae bacterium]